MMEKIARIIFCVRVGVCDGKMWRIKLWGARRSPDEL